jgi:hypothetical protein
VRQALRASIEAARKQETGAGGARSDRRTASKKTAKPTHRPKKAA